MSPGLEILSYDHLVYSVHALPTQMDEFICIQEIIVLYVCSVSRKSSKAGAVYTMYHIFRLFILYMVVTL